MPSTRQLKSRIRSVKSNKQITKAMELVAASKLRKAQDAARASTAYALAARELLTQLGRTSDVQQFTFFKKRDITSRLVILITSDRGLAGAYNANVIKHFVRVLHDDEKVGIKTHVICIGRRGAQFATRLKNIEVVGVYPAMPDIITANDFRPILVAAVDLFIEEHVDSVEIISTRFVNSFIQTATTTPLLPAVFETTDVSEDIQRARFEPSISVVLEGATIRLLESQLYQALLDAKASEHSMRRVAMKNATDNANDLVEDLTLEMNKVRQAAITQELAEISSGAEAMK